ncbi:MAG: NifU family protein [Nitrospirota bacterium]
MLKKRVEEVLEKVRGILKTEEGDIELVEIRDGIVYVRLKGACSTCSMSSLTIKNCVEMNLKKEIPEVVEVKAV